MKAATRKHARLLLGLELAGFLALLLLPIAAAAADQCKARVALRLDDEVENPRDPGFLGSLTANPLYSLTWVKSNGAREVYDLTGPGTDYQCQGGIEILRRDASVLDLRVIEPKATN